MAATLLVMLALSGCGSSGGSASSASRGASGTTAGSPGSAGKQAPQFTAEGNAICARAQQRARALTQGARLKPESFGAAVRLLTQTFRELEKLQPPVESAAGFRRFLALARAEINILAAAATALRNHDPRAARALTSKLVSSASNRAAAKIGLTVCAQETG
ncbi:MAG: hypothetical protein ACYDC2_12700 [Solirubrobacteraceae bacterium]